MGFVNGQWNDTNMADKEPPGWHAMKLNQVTIDDDFQSNSGTSSFTPSPPGDKPNAKNPQPKSS